MNRTVETNPDFIPIARMAPWSMWVRTRFIDVTPEAEAAFLAGRDSPEERDGIAAKLQFSFESLRDAAVPGVQEWMTTRRAAS